MPSGDITDTFSDEKRTIGNDQRDLSRKVMFEENTFSPEELEDERTKRLIKGRLYEQIDAMAGNYKELRSNVGLARDLYSKKTKQQLLERVEKYETIANDLKNHSSKLSTGMQLTFNILLVDALINEFREDDSVSYDERNSFFLIQKATGRLRGYARNGDGMIAQQLNDTMKNYLLDGYLSENEMPSGKYPECDKEWVQSSIDEQRLTGRTPYHVEMAKATRKEQETRPENQYISK